MNNIKKVLSLLAILVILIALYFVSLKLRDQSRTNLQRNNSGQSDLQGTYQIENKELGYKFELTDKFFSRYQEERHGLTTYYKVPTKDIKWNADGTIYADVFAITAIPKPEVEKFGKICDGRSKELSRCELLNNNDGKNNFYYFVVTPTQDPPSDFIESGIVDEGLKFAKAMQTFDITGTPTNFVYENLAKGYSFTYPSYLSNENNDAVNSIGLPFVINKNFYPEPGLSLTLPIKYCALSGKCQPSTVNLAIALGQIDLTEAQLLKTPISQSLIKSLVGGQTVYRYEEGAEGEGIIYNFVLNESNGPKVSPKIFVVALRYIDETVNRAYADQTTFIPFGKQKQIVSNIIKSLEFQTPINKQ